MLPPCIKTEKRLEKEREFECFCHVATHRTTRQKRCSLPANFIKRTSEKHSHNLKQPLTTSAASAAEPNNKEMKLNGANEAADEGTQNNGAFKEIAFEQVA